MPFLIAPTRNLQKFLMTIEFERHSLFSFQESKLNVRFEFSKKTTFNVKEKISGLVTGKERRIAMPKNIFISVILLVCIILAFIDNACSVIHPFGEEEYEILVLLLAGTFKKAKKGD